MVALNPQETDNPFNSPENRKPQEKRNVRPHGEPDEFDQYFARYDVPVSLSRLLTQYVEWIQLQSDADALEQEMEEAAEVDDEPDYLFVGPESEEDEELEEENEDEEEYWQPLWTSFLQFVKEVNEISPKDNLTMRVDYVLIKARSEKIVVPDAFAGLFQVMFQKISSPTDRIKTCADIRITDIDGNLVEYMKSPIELMTGTFANPYTVGVTEKLYQRLQGNFLEIDQIHNDVDNTVF